MANCDKEEAFQGNNHGNESPKKSKARKRDKSRAKDNRGRHVAAKVDPGERNKDKFVPSSGCEFKNDCNQPSQFRKNYEVRKKGVTPRNSCYLCGDKTHGQTWGNNCHS
ncbi:hypothetical protein HAX54_047437 [Datura stramonium]|uniref:Uncharacterized protein n=1 Tax=Datura stramonium TaxID=4076 RepID=A0ABS8SSL4_DATST|nr:hypothetical protein [Datura stramonium]